MTIPEFVPWDGFEAHAPDQVEACARQFYRGMQKRRSIRSFSDRSVPDAVINGGASTVLARFAKSKGSDNG